MFELSRGGIREKPPVPPNSHESGYRLVLRGKMKQHLRHDTDFATSLNALHDFEVEHKHIPECAAIPASDRSTKTLPWRAKQLTQPRRLLRALLQQTLIKDRTSLLEVIFPFDFWSTIPQAVTNLLQSVP